jgi:Gas vesicle protein K
VSPRRSRRAPARRRRARTTKRRAAPSSRPVDVLEPDLETIRRELARAADASAPPRWNANPEDVRRSVVKLVLTLVELLRKLMERQAIRRMEQGTLTDDETEKLGTSLMRLEETIREIGAQFDLRPEDLNLDLGPVGKLM